MRFTPAGSRALRHYAFVVITKTDEEQRRSGDRRKYPAPCYQKGQIVVCDISEAIPIEVGTRTVVGKTGCQFEPFEVLAQAIEFSREVCGIATRGRKRRR